MSEFPITDRNRVRRAAKRGQYDEATVHAILDAGSICHVSFVVDHQPYVIPTIYGRQENRLYLHGSIKSRMLNRLPEALPVCITVTHLDGIVLARSLFHHSMNYRSVVCFGKAREVEGPEKLEALKVVSDQILGGRWEEARQPNAKEMQATSVLAVEIESASAKIRSGDPVDDREDLKLPIWAGVLPVKQVYGAAVPAANLQPGIDLPDSLNQVDHNDKESL